MQEHRPPAAVWTIPTVFAILYAIWPLLGLPQFFYAPETRDVFWYRPEGVALMGWYGRLTLAAATGIVIGTVLSLVIRRCPETWQRRGPWIAAVAVAVSMLTIAIHETTHWIL